MRGWLAVKLERSSESPTQYRPGRPDLDHAVLALLHLPDFLQTAFILVEHIVRPLPEEFARPRQRHLAAGPIDEIHPQFTLKCLNLRAERGLRHVQPLGRAGEAQLFGEDHETLELA